MPNLAFGWHMPSCPLDGASAAAFLSQLDATLARIQPTFDSVWVDDHMIPGGAWVSNETPYLECLTTIASLAARHSSLKFGSSVLCQSYRNPALMAKMVANIQWLTGGRFLFGIGAGWMEEEYRQYNFPFDTAGTRVEEMEEAIAICKLLWTEAPATFHGKHYRIEGANCAPRPDPLPPILIGGGGEQKTLRVVARHADWWNLPGGTVADYARKLDILRRYCADIGRDYGAIVKTWSPEAIALAETAEEAHQRAEASLYRKDVIIGTPAQVAEALRPYVEMGVECFIVRLVDFPSTAGLDLFAREVVPLLRAAASTPQ